MSAYPIRGKSPPGRSEELLDDLHDETVHDLTLADLETSEFNRITPPSNLVPTLTVLGGVHSGQVFRLRRGRNLIGRDPQAHIFLDSSRISRHHCEVDVGNIDNSSSESERMRLPCGEITDLGSTNGTRCNGRRLSARQPIKMHPRDQIDLGGGATLAFGVMREDELSHQLRLYSSANQDELTGAYNKRHILTRMEEELSWASRKQRPLSLIVLDLDHFKSVNDTYGHDVGDMVLKGISLRVLGVLRREDIFGRYGGEEFIILMRDTPVGEAINVAERIRQKIARWPITTSDGVVQATASLGVACSSEAESWEQRELFKLADQRLYQAKDAGRDQVIGPNEPSKLSIITERR
jgi:two-component system cell cycle response regulator